MISKEQQQRRQPIALEEDAFNLTASIISKWLNMLYLERSFLEYSRTCHDQSKEDVVDWTARRDRYQHRPPGRQRVCWNPCPPQELSSTKEATGRHPTPNASTCWNGRFPPITLINGSGHGNPHSLSTHRELPNFQTSKNRSLPRESSDRRHLLLESTDRRMVMK
jgi:hypothetical protein